MCARSIFGLLWTIDELKNIFSEFVYLSDGYKSKCILLLSKNHNAMSILRFSFPTIVLFGTTASPVNRGG